MTTQLHSDLQQLRAVAAPNWSETNCLHVCMNDIWREKGGDFQSNDAYNRKAAMRSALGFRTPDRLYTWNDEYGRTTQDILDRIDTALEGIA